jgi:hypothetical protein
MESTVNTLLKEIKKSQTQVARSAKDEVRVMRAMLNDTSYEVSTYDNNGPTGSYCPAKDFKAMCASVIAGAAHISNAEATAMMENYNVSNKDASAMVNVSKEYINTYMQTGRKLFLGGRETSAISLSGKHVPESTRLYPEKVGVNNDGTPRYKKTPSSVPAHESIRVHAPCPPWVK